MIYLDHNATTPLRPEALEAESRRVGALRDRLERQLLEAVPRVRVNGAGSTRVPNTKDS